MSKKARNSEGCSIDMTPMIDVVFQLIIFFIVTITISEAKDEEVRLELGPNGEEIEAGGDDAEKSSVLVIDIGPRGRVSIANLTIDERRLDDLIRRRVRSGKTFQVWIRGDFDVPHSYVKRVMDVCTNAGVGRVHFVAIKDIRTAATREKQAERRVRR